MQPIRNTFGSSTQRLRAERARRVEHIDQEHAGHGYTPNFAPIRWMDLS